MTSRKGFTLIEIFITVSISVLLSAAMILYNRTGERQIALFKDQARVINLILRAKSLALQTYTEGSAACGYGVHFDSAIGAAILFKDQAADCANSDNVYSGPSEEIGKVVLPSGEKFSQLDFSDITFIPPDPRVVITPVMDSGLIVISPLDDSSQVKIRVNSAGQVTQG